MTVSLPMVALFGLLLFFLLRARYLGAGSALVAALFGLYLGATPAGPAVNGMTHTFLAALAGAVAHTFA